MLAFLYYYLSIVLPVVLEGFPVSSSGHVLLFEHILRYFNCFLPVSLVPETLDHILHGPVAIIVLCFFYQRWKILLNWPYGMKFLAQLAMFVTITTGITAIGYVLFHEAKYTIPLYGGYAITSVLLLSLLQCPMQGNTRLSLGNAAALGAAQALSLLPGISRFGCTFTIARWLGFSSPRAFELSFFIELPISMAGFAKALWSLGSLTAMANVLHLSFLSTMLISGYVGFYGFKLVYAIILRNRIWMFGLYTIVLSVVSWIVQ